MFPIVFRDSGMTIVASLVRAGLRARVRGSTRACLHWRQSILRGLTAPRFEICDVQPNGSLVALPDFHRDCDHYNLLAVPAARLGAVRSISSVGAARTESENMRRAINP